MAETRKCEAKDNRTLVCDGEEIDVSDTDMEIQEGEQYIYEEVDDENSPQIRPLAEKEGGENDGL